VPEFTDPGMYPSWAAGDSLLAAHHPAKFGGCPMSGTLLATDQVRQSGQERHCRQLFHSYHTDRSYLSCST
jgi:hypothetical protein